MIKYITIPVAAFMITATGASAFTSGMLDRIDIDLSEAQVSALEQAHELRAAGADRSEVRALLDEAGLDRETLTSIRDAVKTERSATREAIHVTIAAEDYDAFVGAAAGTKLIPSIPRMLASGETLLI